MVGVLILLALLLVGCFYGVYVLFSLLGIAYPMNTGSWIITSANAFKFKHPKSWNVNLKSNSEENGEEYTWTIPSLGIPGNPITADLQYKPNIDKDAEVCTEEKKIYAQEFSYVYSKPQGVKCVFTDAKIGTTQFQGKAYVYNFHSDDDSRTITLTVQVPSWVFPDPQLEKKLDTVVDSMIFE